MNNLRTCSKCKTTKSADEFYSNHRWCKICLIDNSKQYYLTHKEVASVRDKLYCQTHRKEKCTNSKKYYWSNREHILLRIKNYKLAHREYSCISSALRRSRKSENGGSFTKEEWNLLCAYYTPVSFCLSCREVWPLEIDHVIPIRLGGTSNIDNLQPLCGKCNIAKYTKIIDYRFDSGAFAKAILLARDLTTVGT